MDDRLTGAWLTHTLIHYDWRPIFLRTLISLVYHVFKTLYNTSSKGNDITIQYVKWNKHMFILYVLEITSGAYVYFPTMRLHFSTRKRKRACLNNGTELVLNHILRLYCILFQEVRITYYKWRRGSFWERRLLTQQQRILNKLMYPNKLLRTIQTIQVAEIDSNDCRDINIRLVTSGLQNNQYIFRLQLSSHSP